jgi:DNA invertase Pin-like site-specific DNA recombinase
MSKRVCLYSRVSTLTQSVEPQLQELRLTAERMGYVIVEEFIDNGISGATQSRPALDAMMKMAYQKRFDMVMCWSVDRMGRSLGNLIQLLNELSALKIDLFFQQQAIDTTTPTGKMMFSILGALGSYERELIKSRVKSGLALAKKNGVKLGRPTTINKGIKEALFMLRDKGIGVRESCRRLGIGCGSYYKIISEKESA